MTGQADRWRAGRNPTARGTPPQRGRAGAPEPASCYRHPAGARARRLQVFRYPESARAPTPASETRLTYRPAPVPPGAASAPAIEARLEPGAIGVAQDAVIGMASFAPAGTTAAAAGHARFVLRSPFFQTPREST